MNNDELAITRKAHAVGYKPLSEMGDAIFVFKYYGLQCFPIALFILRSPVTLLVN